MLLPDGVTKRVMHSGRGDIPNFCHNSKVLFHYRAMIQKDNEDVVLDDSRKNKVPLIHKNFCANLRRDTKMREIFYDDYAQQGAQNFSNIAQPGCTNISRGENL